jgi:hypothetical protein
MGLMGLIGHRFGWSDDKIRKASAVLDILYLIGYIAILYEAVFFMGQIHYCNELFKGNFGYMFGLNDSFMKFMNVTPNASDIWNNSPLNWLPH